MIRFDPAFTLAEVSRIANYLDASLVQDGRGNITITPRRPRHGNETVVKMPRRHRKYMHTRLPEPPDAA